MIKVLEVNNIDIYGRSFNGYDLLNDLNNTKFSVSMAVINKLSDDARINKIIDDADIDKLYQLSLIEEKLSFHNLLSVSSPALMELKQYKDADIVHFHMFHNTKLSIPSLINISREKKVIISLHDPWFLTGRCVHFEECSKWKNGCNNCKKLNTMFPFFEDNCNKMWKIKKEVLNNSNIEYIVSSKWMYDLAMESEMIKDKKCIHYIPLGVDLKKFRKLDIKNNYNISSDNVVLFLRAQNEFKGTQYVLEALKELKTNKKISIITCDTKGLLDDLKPKYNVIDLGNISQEEIINAFNVCDIFLMASIGESFGMMAVEAMACSKPVIAFENTALPSVIHSPECGYVVQNKNSHELMVAIKHLIDNKKEREKRGALGRQICEEEYAYEKYINKIEKLYVEVYEKKYAKNLNVYNKNYSDSNYMDFESKIMKIIKGESKGNISIDEKDIVNVNKINERIFQKYIHSSNKIRSYNPKVSIVVPVYNGENFVNEAIDSILSQTYKNYEIIVVDDGSKDRTKKVLQKYKNKIRYFYKENGGVASALNYGISKMTGDYFAWLSHDDCYYPNKLESQIDVLSQLSDKNTIIFSNFDLVNESCKFIAKTNYLNNTSNKELCKTYYPVLKGIINGDTILINKKCFEDVGLFDERLKTTQDYDMWYRLFKKYASYCVNESLVKYRVHPNQDTNKNPAAKIEGNAFWKKIVKDLNNKEIEKWGKDPFSVYMNFHFQMKNSGFKEAADIAYREAKKYYCNPPLVSIIIPCYNAEKYIKQALDSAINQTFTNIEIIVVDDGSEDNSYEIVSEYMKKDFRIFLHKNSFYKGVAGALNTGLKLARGEFFARLDADDTIAMDKIESQYYLLKNSKYGFIATNINMMDTKSNIYKKNVYNELVAPINYLIAFMNPVPNATIMYRMEMIKKFNLEFSNIKTSEDFDFLARYVLLTKLDGFFIPYGLYNYRKLDNSLFHSNIEESISNAKRIAKKYYTSINGKYNYNYENVCEFYYLDDDNSIIVNEEKYLTLFREFYESCSKFFDYSDKEKNNTLLYIVDKYNQHYNYIQPVNDLSSVNYKKAYVPKTKIGNKFIYYYRTHGAVKTVVWIGTYPLKYIKRKLLKQ